MRRIICRAAYLTIFTICLSITSFETCIAQQPVAARNLYERVWAVVPMVGAGTHDDPKRPLHAPLPSKTAEERAAAGRSGIISFSFELSDDGQFALVEFVARDRKGLEQILSENRPGVKVFEKGKATREEVLTEFRKHKRNFDIDRFAGGAK